MPAPEALIYVPVEWTPLVDDAARLMMLADWFDERACDYMAKLCRWTANEWTWARGLKRADCLVGLEVWARYGSQGWSRGVIDSVGPKQVIVRFPYRHNGMSRGARAWWDLVPRLHRLSRGRAVPKPKPRRGYTLGTNASFAGCLMGSPGRAYVEREPTHTPAPWEHQPSLPGLDLTHPGG